MAVQIDASRFRIDITTSAAKIDSSNTETHFFGHLTEGWSGSNWTGDAITATGFVPISVGSNEFAEIGFVQLARAVKWQAFYAGRTHREGAVTLDFFKLPAMTSTLLMDVTKNSQDPWYRVPTTIFRTQTAKSEWGDHPGLPVRLKHNNREVSNVPNYLFHVIMDRQFVTVLTVKANNGPPQYVGFFEWRLCYEFKLKWENGKPVVRTSRGSVIEITTKPTAGRPPAEHWQNLLNNPTGEHANDVGGRADIQTNNLGPPNRLDLKERYLNVEPDFWS